MDISYTICQRKKNIGSNVWYLRTNAGGRISYKSLKTESRKVAQANLDALIAQKFLPASQREKDIPLSTLFAEWERHIEYQSANTLTVIAYKSRFNHFKRYCEENQIESYRLFSKLDAERFAQSLSRESPKTIREIIKVAKLCFNWGIENFGLPEGDKFKNVKTPKVQSTRAEFWTKEEIEKILSAAPNPFYKAFWALMAFAGLRFSEARNLRIENINGNVITVINGKGGKNAEVPVSSKLAALIAPIMDGRETGLLIPENEIPMRSDHAVNVLKVAAQFAGITTGETSHHKLRHSFASELLRNGINPRTVQELGRWSSASTLFKHYAHIMRDDMAKAVETL